jgi:hypothetical protein
MGPTALTVLGVEVPPWMEGRSQLRALEPGRALPLGAESLATAHEAGAPWTEAQQAVLEERLRRLGYL